MGEVIFFDRPTARHRRAPGYAVAGAVLLVSTLCTPKATWAQAVRLDLRIDPHAAVFSSDELTDAVGLRGSVVAEPGPGVTDVVVTAPEVGRVLIQVGVRARQLEIKQGTPATDAARLAALLIWDLVRPLPPLTPGASAPPSGPSGSRGAISPTAPAAASARIPVAVDRTPALPPSSDAAASFPGTFDVSMTASVALRTTDAGPAFAPLVESQWSTGVLVLSAAAGYDRAAVTVRGTDGDQALGLSTVPVRVGVGARVRAFRVRAGVLARAYFTDGVTHDRGVLWGAFAAATAELPVRGPFVPFATVGLDVHARPVAFSLVNQRVLAVHTLGPWLGVGLSWTWGRA